MFSIKSEPACFAYREHNAEAFAKEVASVACHAESGIPSIKLARLPIYFQQAIEVVEYFGIRLVVCAPIARI